jgi:hypothetical protein
LVGNDFRRPHCLDFVEQYIDRTDRPSFDVRRHDTRQHPCRQAR